MSNSTQTVKLNSGRQQHTDISQSPYSHLKGLQGFAKDKEKRIALERK